MEGHWENEPGSGVPLTLFGLPDMDKEETRYALNIPRLGSLILTHSWDGQFPGLKSYPAADRPNVPVVFWSFRVMVGLGLLMIALAIWALWTRWRGRLHESRALQRFALWMGPSGLIAMLAGWYVTEVGRQPWVVYGVMRTADAATPHGLGELTLTLALFVAVYLLVFGAGVSYMLRLIRMGPTPAPGHAPLSGGPGEPRQPSRPCPPPPPAPACRRKPRIREPEMGIDLALIWAVIILFGIMMYVIMDGFDLGIGILFPLVSDPGARRHGQHRGARMGRQRDLAGAGRRRPDGRLSAGLFRHSARAASAAGVHAAGPDLPWRGLRVPLQGRRTPPPAVGPRLRAGLDLRHFFQGVALGAYIEGIPVVGRVYQGGPWDWISPLLAVHRRGFVAAYALLGCTLADHEDRGRVATSHVPRRQAADAGAAGRDRRAQPVDAAGAAADRAALVQPAQYVLVPARAAAGGGGRLRPDPPRAGAPAAGPFLLSLGLVFLGYSGLGISIWPAIIPPDVSIWTAAAPPQSLGFALVGALAIIPVILMYTAWSYYVFRGKVRAGEGYH